MQKYISPEVAGEVDALIQKLGQALFESGESGGERRVAVSGFSDKSWTALIKNEDFDKKY